jgi:hypothetical protein
LLETSANRRLAPPHRPKGVGENDLRDCGKYHRIKGTRVNRQDWNNHRLGQHVFDSAIGKVADNATLLEAGVAVNRRLVGWLPKHKKTTTDQVLQAMDEIRYALRLHDAPTGGMSRG